MVGGGVWDSLVGPGCSGRDSPGGGWGGTGDRRQRINGCRDKRRRGVTGIRTNDTCNYSSLSSTPIVQVEG